MTRKQNRKSGFTMIEAAIAMVILATAAAGILLPFSNAAAVQVEGARQTLAANLATEMMEKVLTTDPGDLMATYGESYIETKGAMLDAEGGTHTDSIYSGFSRTVSCQPATVASVDLVAVTVTVFYQGNEMTRITTLVSQ